MPATWIGSLERNPSADARDFAVGIGLSEDDVFDLIHVYSAASNHFSDNGRTEVFDRHRAQCLAEAADRCACRGDDGCTFHCGPVCSEVREV